ncbi:MAG TPA: hypothetical protein DDW30_06005 [Clostridiales bacterium]|nr:hypothetical protein [Clostridiales bacterium]
MTNIVEYIGRDVLNVLPLVYGETAGSADFEVFRAFCGSAEQAPDSADVRYVRELLQSRLDCGLPLDRAHCAEIWRRTADAFLTRDVPCPPEPPRLPCPALPIASGAETEAKAVTDCPPLRGAGSWAEWEANTKKALAESEAVRVWLPVGFRAKKMSLWQAERILCGAAVDSDGEAVQQTDFLAGFCTAERRLVMDSACDPREVLALAEQIARRRGGMPPLVWCFPPAAAPDRETLVSVLRLIRAPRGVVPILTNRTV